MTKRLRYAGLAKEANFGTAENSADFHVDIASSSLDTPTDAEMVFQGGMGRSPSVRRPAYYSVSGNIVYVVDIETIAEVLKWTLGGYEYTDGGVDTPNTHEIWGADDFELDSFTAFVGKDVFEHVFAGCTINSLELAVEGEFVQLTLDVVGAADERIALAAAGDLTLPDDYPLTFVETGVNIGGDISADVKSLTLTINNNADADAGRGMGQRTPYRIPVNARETTASLSLWFENTNYLENFWGGATAPDDVDGADSLDVEISLSMPTADGRSATISLPNAYINAINIQPSGRDELVQDVELTAMRDTVTLDDAVTTVETEILATVVNNRDDLT